MEYRLFVRKKFTGVVVRQDDIYPSMWRVHWKGRVSDMVNLIRAKDAALCWVTQKRGGGIAMGEAVNWEVRRMDTEGQSGRFSEIPATTLPEPIRNAPQTEAAE